MAIEKVYISGGGVAQIAFDGHTHSYRRLDTIGIDISKNWVGPAYETVLDDQEVFVTDGGDAEAISVEVSTQPTSTPV